MECHRHPSAPGVAYCTNCHVFLCRVCADLQSPAQCTDCLLATTQEQIAQIIHQLRTTIVIGATVLVLVELILAVYAPGLGAVFLGMLAAYLVASFVLAGYLGPIVAPYRLTTNLQMLSALREAEATILKAQEIPLPVASDT
jgi:hypothetical protein